MKLALFPIDTWFFRDGTPFDKDGSSQAGVVGVFPPYPPTVAGAIRAALAMHHGWDGHGRWGREITTVLGDGPDDLGRLRITGPFVIRDGAPMFPMPRHVVGRVEPGGRWVPVTQLRPGPSVLPSDLGARVRLPWVDRRIADGPALEPAGGCWVSLAGLQRILHGELPRAENMAQEHTLWAGEPRVGIERTPGSRTVADGALYSTQHVRLAAGVGLGLELHGLPIDWSVPSTSMVPLGGESRLAACEAWQGTVAFDVRAGTSRTAVLIALTPLLLDAEVLRGSAALSIGGARLVSACVARPLRIGGWDSERRAPLPLRNAVPPGSALFCEVEDPEAFQEAAANGLVRVGAATVAGFGLCAVGHAPTWERTT